jgi:putative iron-dependent peroxidase
MIDADARQPQILRANIPFATTLAVTEQMLVNMFIGRPAGSYDRILDFSTAVIGGPGHGR